MDDGATSAEAKQKTIVPSLIAPYAQPRATATALFAGHTRELEASEVSRLLSAKEDWLVSMDRTLSIEIGFLSGMVGAGGEEVVLCLSSCLIGLSSLALGDHPQSSQASLLLASILVQIRRSGPILGQIPCPR